MHWALDDAHVAALGLPPGGGHTLADGLDRLFLGHALPAVVGEPFAGLLPAGDAEGSDALALGALWRVAQALARLQAAVAQPLPPARWAALLADTLAAWVAPADDDLDALRELRQALQTLARRWQEARLTEPLPLDLVRQALTALLDDAVRGGVPTGAVTFSALPSLRGLPYRVVAVLGLNDGEFPAAPRPAEYDLLAVAPRRGDRQRRADDRNLFLDLLLSAREVLHLSCTGRSVRDNAPLPPSVLVDELLDHLEPVVVGGARARLRVEHPLQAFAEAPFRADADPRLRSHRADLAEALRAAARARLAAAAASDTGGTAASAGGSDAAVAAVAAGTEGDDAAADAQAETGSDSDGDGDEDSPADTAQAPFFAMPLPPPEPALRRVDLADWLAFFRHPQRFLLRRRLGLALPRADDELQDDEPFVPDGLARHALARRLLPPLLAGAELASVAALARAGTELPAGAFGQAMLDAELAALDRHARRVRQATLSDTLAPLDLRWRTEIDGQAWQLDAALADLRPEGLVRERFGALRGSDVVQAWIEHLLLCAAAPDGVLLGTTWLARDAHLRLLPCDDAGLQLDTLMRLYARGLREPLPFFPRTAWAYLQDPAKPDNLRAAQAAWQPGPRNPGAEGADPQIRLALRGRPDPLGPEALPDFHRTAHAVFDGVLACRASDDEVELSFGHFIEGRVEDIFVVDKADAGRTDRTFERSSR